MDKTLLADSFDSCGSLVMTRRSFAKAGTGAGIGLAAALGAGLGVAASSASAWAEQADSSQRLALQADESAQLQLPPASPDPDSPFSVDLNINMDTIDDYLGIPGVAYRDMRMLKDPADYASIGGDSVLSIALEGFKIVPFPYIGTLQELPVAGAYDGDRLFDIEWTDDGTVANAIPRYEQSELIISDLFPADKPIIVCCGGGGYAGMMRQLLIYLGYDGSCIYNAGGVWDYTGYYPVELARYDDQTDSTEYFMWRADQAQIDFAQLTRI